MNGNWQIKIFYGPYQSNGIIKHQFYRIQGLLSKLSQELYFKFQECMNFQMNLSSTVWM